jgi:hypothetical protein
VARPLGGEAATKTQRRASTQPTTWSPSSKGGPSQGG